MPVHTVVKIGDTPLTCEYLIAGARREAGQTGVGDSGSRQSLDSYKGRTAGPAAGSKAGTAAAMAIRTTAGEPAGLQQPAGSAARRPRPS
jgi:hypothetical protein